MQGAFCCQYQGVVALIHRHLFSEGMSEFGMDQKNIIRSPGICIWRQIEEVLSADILAGHLSHRLPNETALAERFNVNRHTVRQAMKALVERGMVDVQHGRGTFVRDDIIDYQVGRRTRLAHSVANARRIGVSKVLHWSAMSASAEVRQLLDLSSKASVLGIETLDVVDDKVIGVCTQYFPLPRFAGLGELYAKNGITHLALEQFGILQFQRRMSRVTARMPSKEIARQLSQPSTLPVLYVEAVYVDEAGSPIEYGISRFCSTAVQVVIEPD
ncbi:MULTISPECIES: phosphonate metabolism transcriptional regulator PhnF [unclassified Undibacterium]|nr:MULTISPECIES: phosphonate metabolism transcriptional regulator PhnF [unclassified Undibacterium]MEB0173005.1 phosphonate metabolism transcriptional regulator PhnF [Undibacterium sp. CCC1.1]MEB0176841.1 phosphonate metabolism transcriptional regulator PhnF [Undibacterium sp. CCC3.4]MEB0216073.1 phosphonate metabolism transcriptional regulator PhnF [Undibacterium sp. 5I2]